VLQDRPVLAERPHPGHPDAPTRRWHLSLSLATSSPATLPAPPAGVGRVSSPAVAGGAGRCLRRRGTRRRRPPRGSTRGSRPGGGGPPPPTGRSRRPPRRRSARRSVTASATSGGLRRLRRARTGAGAGSSGAAIGPRSLRSSGSGAAASPVPFHHGPPPTGPGTRTRVFARSASWVVRRPAFRASLPTAWRSASKAAATRAPSKRVNRPDRRTPPLSGGEAQEPPLVGPAFLGRFGRPGHHLGLGQRQLPGAEGLVHLGGPGQLVGRGQQGLGGAGRFPTDPGQLAASWCRVISSALVSATRLA